MKTKEQLEKSLAKLDANLAALHEQYHKLSEQINVLCGKREPIVASLSKMRQGEMGNPENFSADDWKYILSEDNMDGMEKYRFAQKVADKYGLEFGGYIHKTQQKTVQLRLVRNDRGVFDKHLKFLKMVLPHILPSEIDAGENEVVAKYIDLLDSGLSEYAHYFALVNEETGVYWAMQNRYGSVTCNAKLDSLEELLEYLNKHHYYTTGEAE